MNEALFFGFVVVRDKPKMVRILMVMTHSLVMVINHIGH